MIDIGAIVLLGYIVLAMAARLRSGSLVFPHFGRLARESRHGVIGQLISLLLVDMGTSKPLRTCDRVKWTSHILVFWGFVFDSIATVLDDLMNHGGATLPLDHPVMLFGNSGGVLLVVGCCAMFYSRFQESGSIWDVHKSDFFLLALLLTAVTGFATENAIYSIGRSAIETAAIYWAHLAAIVTLFATAPFTKFTHALYKPAWLLRDKMLAGGGQQAPAGVPGPGESAGLGARSLEDSAERRNS